MTRTVCYLSLERLRPATAANTHVRGVLAELQRCGWKTVLIAEVPRNGAAIGLLRQGWRYLALQVAAGFRLPSTDVVYVRQHFATWPLVALARAMGKPVVLELNGLPGDVLASNPRFAYLRRLIAWCYIVQFRWAAKILVVTEGLRTYVRCYAEDAKIVVVPNGADADLFRALNQPRPVDVPVGNYVVLFGDFAIWHDIELLIEASREPTWPADVQIVVIGRGSAEALAEMSKAAVGKISAGMIGAGQIGAGKISWLGWIEQDKLAAYIVHAMTGVVPISAVGRRAEIGAIPLKLLEILSCGRPAIVSDLPTQSDLVRQNGCGLVFARGDASDLARAVRQIADQPERARDMGARGRALIEARYSWTVVGATISDLLDHVVTPNSTKA